MKNNNLFLIVNKKWYDKIASGQKTVEYRGLTEYWLNRLAREKYIKGTSVIIDDGSFTAREFETVEFQLGYSKKYPRLKFKINKIQGILTPESVKDTVKTEYCLAIYFKKRLTST